MSALLRYLTETVWAVDPAVMQSAIGIFERHLSGVSLATGEVERITAIRTQRDLSRGSTAVREKVGTVSVIPVEGFLARHASMVNGVSQPEGMASEDLIDQIRSAASDPSVRSILLAIDSPGGSTNGIAELAAAVKEATYRKRVVAVARGPMTSAAYWAAVNANAIYAGRTDPVGSIGVMALIRDVSEANAKAGVKFIPLSSGKYKGASLAPGAKPTDADIGEVQRQMDEMMRVFTASVSDARGLKGEALEDVANGRVFIGQQALDAGLIDGIKSYDEVLDELQNGKAGTAGASRVHAAVGNQTMSLEKTTLDDLKAQRPDLIASIEKPISDKLAAAELKAADAAKPKPATFAELNATFAAKGDAGKVFITEALAANMTMNDALSAWAGKVEKQNADLAAQVAENAKKSAKAPGADPVRAGAPPAGGNTDGLTDFGAAVKHVMATEHVARNIAAARARVKYPDLFAAWKADGFPELAIA